MLIDLVITSANNSATSLFEACYVYFNWLEAFSWLCFATYIWWRFLKYRRTKLELIYGFCLVVFGVTDVLEVF